MKDKVKNQVKCRLKKGDEVIIIAGGHGKGLTGKIDRIDRKTGRVYLEGMPTVKRHTKPSMANQEGGIVDKVKPLPIQKVALVDPKTRKPTRVGYKVVDGQKVRFAKKSGTVLS